MKEYEILEHKADLKIRAFGNSREDLFLNMLKGMNSVLFSGEGQGSARKQKVEIKSSGVEILLVDFLNEVLYLDQTNRAVYDYFTVRRFTNFEIKAELQGKKAERFEEDIKAATCHDLEIKQNKNKVSRISAQ